MLKLIIIGGGGFGREVLWLAQELNKAKPTYALLGFLDDSPDRHGTTVNGLTVLGGLDLVASYAQDPDVRLVIAMGEPDVKRAIAQRLAAWNPRYAILIDPTARGHWEWVQLGQGSIICAGAILTTNITVGDHVILDRLVNVGHDSMIGSYTTVAPNATISGGVTLGEGNYLGSSSTIRDEVTIGDWSIIGMGAVVTKSVPAEVTMAGVPARLLRQNTLRRVW